MTRLTRSLSSPPVFRLSLGACLALLAACPPDTAQPTTSTSDAESTSTGTPATDTGEPTTTGTTGPMTTDPTTGPGTTGPAPVCGDGVVGGLELCDDGNDVPEDGCNSKCEPTAAIEWTKIIDFNKNNDGAGDVVVDKTGRIIIVGWADGPDAKTDQLVLVLDPDGNEVWKKTFDGMAGLDDSLSSVAVDDMGRIFAGGRESVTDMQSASVVRALTPDGDPLWEFNEPNVETDFANVSDVTLIGGALYSVGTEEFGDKGVQMVVRRHDPAKGDMPAWRAETKADTFYAVGNAIAPAGQDLIVVGYAGSKFTEAKPLIAHFTTAGAVIDAVVENTQDATWSDVVPIGDAGDLLIAGRRVAGVTLSDAIVRRVTADGAEVWSDIYDQDFLYDIVFALAVGPNEAIFAGGVSVKEGENDNALVRRLDGDGTVRWTSLYNNPELDLYEVVSGIALGPDFAVAVGRTTVLGQGSDVWVRRYKAD